MSENRWYRDKLIFRAALGGAVLCCAAMQVPAAEEAQSRPVAEADSLENELLAFQDIPVVITSARRPQEGNLLSAPISVVTEDDIHYGGLTTFPEVLQFSPGIDVLWTDRNYYGVGIHGLHDYLSNRTLPLIDGRKTGNAMNGGGLDFLHWPVFLEDVKRIELVRSPGSAAWGTNALNGIINIITKDTEDCLGWLASTTWNQYGDSYNHIRWAGVEDRWS